MNRVALLDYIYSRLLAKQLVARESEFAIDWLGKSYSYMSTCRGGAPVPTTVLLDLAVKLANEGLLDLSGMVWAAIYAPAERAA